MERLNIRTFLESIGSAIFTPITWETIKIVIERKVRAPTIFIRFLGPFIYMKKEIPKEDIAETIEITL